MDLNQMQKTEDRLHELKLMLDGCAHRKAQIRYALTQGSLSVDTSYVKKVLDDALCAIEAEESDLTETVTTHQESLQIAYDETSARLEEMSARLEEGIT